MQCIGRRLTEICARCAACGSVGREFSPGAAWCGIGCTSRKKPPRRSPQSAPRENLYRAPDSGVHQEKTSAPPQAPKRTEHSFARARALVCTDPTKGNRPQWSASQGSPNKKTSPRGFDYEPTSIRWVSCPLVPASSATEDSCTGHETRTPSKRLSVHPVRTTGGCQLHYTCVPCEYQS